MYGLIIIVGFVMLFLGTANAAGTKGEYIMKGTAYNANMKPLRNVVIVIEAKEKVVVVHTTKTGAYWVKLPYETPCPEGDMPESYKTMFLPIYYTIMWNDKAIKIKNQGSMFYPKDSVINNQRTMLLPGYDSNGKKMDVIQNLIFK